MSYQNDCDFLFIFFSTEDIQMHPLRTQFHSRCYDIVRFVALQGYVYL